ncbi:MAG: protein kinase [Alistipes sp.]|nr:protein kinase [Alistipes sp.]
MRYSEGQLLDERYELKRFIGSGSFGEVWLAIDSQTDLEVAVKIYVSMDDQGLDDFKKEFKLSFNLNHTNLLHANYLGVNSQDSRPYLVMPFCPDGSASKRAGKMPEKELWRFIRDVASGLAYLHEQDPPIIHQDIKPDNILILKSGGYVITDFGISKQLKSSLRRSAMQQLNSTGSIAYMGPERFSKQYQAIKASDIWSLGVTIYELIMDDMPFNGMGGNLQKHGAEIPDLPEEFSENMTIIFTSCLALEPWNRPSARQVAEFAAKCYAGETPKITWNYVPPTETPEIIPTPPVTPPATEAETEVKTEVKTETKTETEKEKPSNDTKTSGSGAEVVGTIVSDGDTEVKDTESSGGGAQPNIGTSTIPISSVTGGTSSNQPVTPVETEEQRKKIPNPVFSSNDYKVTNSSKSGNRLVWLIPLLLIALGGLGFLAYTMLAGDKAEVKPEIAEIAKTPEPKVETPAAAVEEKATEVEPKPAEEVKPAVEQQKTVVETKPAAEQPKPAENVVAPTKTEKPTLTDNKPAEEPKKVERLSKQFIKNYLIYGNIADRQKINDSFAPTGSNIYFENDRLSARNIDMLRNELNDVNDFDVEVAYNNNNQITLIRVIPL